MYLQHFVILPAAEVHGHVAPQRRVLQVGTRRQRPPHISPHLPPFPDPHTYIRTPTFSPPVGEYKLVREKLGKQKRNSRKGLSKLLGKTRPSHPIAGEADKYGVYTVVTCPSPSSPLYLQALMPTPDDAVDSVAADKLANEKSSPPPPPHSETHSRLPTGSGSVTTTAPAQSDAAAASGGDKEERELAESQELYENPFLKPPKRIRLKMLNA
jgi:hypothetical protein